MPPSGPISFKQLEQSIKRVFHPTLVERLKLRLKTRVETQVSDAILERWKRTLVRLLPVGGSSDGNRITVYDNGSTAFSQMWDAIRQAEHRVWIETYILQADPVGLRTIAELEKAARRGCSVVLLYDHLGSLTTVNDNAFTGLLAAGGVVRVFNALHLAPFRLARPFFRNHRKMLVVDNHTAFVGGMNMTQDVGGTSRFRDVMAKVEGPAVVNFAGVFVNSLRRTPSSTKGVAIPILAAPDSYEDGSYVQVLRSDVRKDRRQIQKALRISLNATSTHAFLTSPYFLPPPKIARALLDAAARGVDVRIITAGKCDVPLAAVAAQHIYGRFLRGNVRIFELSNQELHAKIFTSDGLYASIGSYNLDLLSYQSNLEVKMTTLDPRTAEELEDVFLNLQADSKEVTLEAWENRGIMQKFTHWVAYRVCSLTQFF